MELMDESLTHYLESTLGDIPYHIQVNLSSDIAHALAFLHANGIIHRDLSSNNVLLMAGRRAKVTDFGMSTFITARIATMTTCPGTPAFMSPEALNEPPVYMDKCDNFSFGVLLVQIATQQYPEPSDRFRLVRISNPQNPAHTVDAQLAIPEIERRQAHIILIEPTHPLLPIALDCLKDRDVERPSSQKMKNCMQKEKKTITLPVRNDNAIIQGESEAKERQLRILNKQLETIVQQNRELRGMSTYKNGDVSLEGKDESPQQDVQQTRVNNKQLQVYQEQISAKEEQLLAYRQQIRHNDEQLQASHAQIWSGKCFT